MGLKRMCLPHSPPFCATVLKPRLHLSVSHLQCPRQAGPFGRRQVLLAVEPFLQLTDLEPGERCSGFLPLRRGAILVGMPNAASDCTNREMI